MSTATRTLLGFLLIVTAAFYFLVDRLTDRVERQYLEAAEEPMVDIAHVLASFLEEEIREGNLDGDRLGRIFDRVHRRRFEARIYNLEKRSVDMNIYVTDASGIVLFDSRNGLAEGEDYARFHDVLRTLRGGYGARSSRDNEANALTSVMYVGAPIRRGDAIAGVVTVSKPQASMFKFIAETTYHIRLYGWTSLLAAMIAAIAASHWLSSPIRKLTGYARAVRRGERVPMPKLAGADAQALGSALEEMRDSLEDRKYVESYVQTLTHEMKSPVAAIRGAAELLAENSMSAGHRQKFLGNIESETGRLETVIDRLLALSAIETMKSLEHAVRIVINELIEDVCENHRHGIDARGIRLLKHFPRPTAIRGEAFLLETALANLLQNAIDFSPVGGIIDLTVTVTVTFNCTGGGAVPVAVAGSRGADEDRAGETVEIVIEDEGPGIPDYALERVFERFYSLRHPATGRKSSGLGLCFVREAAELHGGSVSIRNRTDRSGARATLRLPTAPDRRWK